MRLLTTGLIGGVAAAILMGAANPAHAAKQCGNDSRGFNAWVAEFRKEAMANGIRKQTLDDAFAGMKYATDTIRLDRNQRSFKLSFDQFMKKRGAATIIKQGKRHKKNNAAALARIEARYGVPPGPLIAIWGMETAFGRFSGDKPIFPALATLAYDCRRSEFFETQLYGALQILQSRQLSKSKMRGAGHGELGQMQFLPA
ncbi:MAG: lytic murein transglycosylase, partial [Pseudomonadota bacterium]